jgi:TonB family protein
MKIGSTVGLVLAAATAAAQGGWVPPRLATAQVGAAPWNAVSGGIAAYEVSLDETGAVAGARIVQDLPPFGALLGEAIRSWRFEPAREGGRAVASRVLALGLFRPPALLFTAPANPRYRDADAPEEIPWPTAVVVPPYPPNAVGSGKVILETDVSSRGAVTGVRILSGPTAFDGAATDTARQWTFRPAARGRQPVESRAVLVFSFVAPS